VIGGIQRVGLDPMPQFQQVLAADRKLTRELRGGHPLGEAAEHQEDLGRTSVCPLPLCSREHVEHPSARLAAVVNDRGFGMTAVDVEPLAGSATGAQVPIGMEQVEELLAADLLVHQVVDRKVHEIGPEEWSGGYLKGQKSTSQGGGKGPTTKFLT
jgi:hypothetical protein